MLINQINQKYQNSFTKFNTIYTMSEKSKSNACCQLEAVVSFDERGQLVLPKDIRSKFNLNAGDKFAVISCTDAQGLCCLTLIKAESLNDAMKDLIIPIVARG